jgi:glycosyltransferase involved in cell wall biosynthesis
METMKFCIATYSLYKGNGVDVSVAEFAKELAKNHEVKIFVARHDMHLPDIEISQYRVRYPWNMHDVAKEMERQKFDYISTHAPPMDVVASMTDIPHLLHDPGVIQANLIRNLPDVYNWAVVNTTRMMSARKAWVVLPVSNYMASEFRRKYFYRGRMEVLHHGIEFPSNEPELPENKFGRYILYVGVHRPYKGVHELMEIFGEVKKELGDDVHLVTIGKKDDLKYYERLKALADRIGNIHMLGYVSDVWAYYAGASVYANCSKWEGEDRPVLEAQYMGKPVVTYNNCSHPEVVFYGSLANNREEFKEALFRHLSEGRTDLSVRPRVVEEFSTVSMAKNFINIVKASRINL